MKSNDVILGVLAGLAAGAILGLLFAPDKGVNTRDQIVSSGENYANILKQKLDDFLRSQKEKYAGELENAQEIVQKESDRMDAIGQSVRDKIS